MSIKDFIMQKTQQKVLTETVTVRLPVAMVSEIDELASTVEVTRQELMHAFIEEGLKVALEAYKGRNTPDLFDEVIEGEEGCEGQQRYFVLNTNKRWNVSEHQHMVSNGVAAAYEDGWKHKIDYLKKGDIVFLYESGVGIVGVGTADGKTQKLDRNGKREEMYQQNLDGFRQVPPLSAKDIKKITNSNMRFLQTMFKIKSSHGSLIKKSLD